MAVLKMRYFINTHKILVPFVILAMMVYYNNFSIGPVVYLALHGSYCVNWLLKELIYPDKSFDEKISVIMSLGGLFTISGYFIAPFLVITSNQTPHLITIFLAIFCNIVGTFLHFGSDAQKYFVLQNGRGLITDGFFARCRHTNYLGEVVTYAGFCVMSEHWLPFAFLFFMFVVIFVPSMNRKEKSLARYEEFREYYMKTNWITPKLG